MKARSAPAQGGGYFLSRSRRLRTYLCEAELISPGGELISRQRRELISAPAGADEQLFLSQWLHHHVSRRIGSTAAYAAVTSRPAARVSMNYTGSAGVCKYHSCAVV